MSNRYSTETYSTGSVSAGANSDANRTGLPSSKLNIVKIAVTASLSGPFDFKIFKKDAFDNADLLAYWDNVQPSLYYPMDNETGSEAEEGPAIPYDDEDGTNELHIRITNNHTAAQTFTVTILYEEPAFGGTVRNSDAMFWASLTF